MCVCTCASRLCLRICCAGLGSCTSFNRASNNMCLSLWRPCKLEIVQTVNTFQVYKTWKLQYSSESHRGYDYKWLFLFMWYANKKKKKWKIKMNHWTKTRLMYIHFKALFMPIPNMTMKIWIYKIWKKSWKIWPVVCSRHLHGED